MTNQECAIQRHRGKQTCTQRGKDLLPLEKLIFCKSQTLRNDDLKSKLYLILFYYIYRDRMVVGFTTTCAISAYHH